MLYFSSYWAREDWSKNVIDIQYGRGYRTIGRWETIKSANMSHGLAKLLFKNHPQKARMK